MVKLSSKDIQNLIDELQLSQPKIALWKIPGPYNGAVSCELWLLEPEGPMSGVQESWSVVGKAANELAAVAKRGLEAMSAEPGTNLAVMLMDFPLFELDKDAWSVRNYTIKDQVRLRRILPLGLLLLMLDVLLLRSS
jgi:hypothetical protein